VTLESVLALVDAARRTGATIAVPTFEGRRGHPTFFYRDVWRELMTVPDGGARAVVRAERARVAEVPVHDAGVLTNVTTPADLSG